MNSISASARSSTQNQANEIIRGAKIANEYNRYFRNALLDTAALAISAVLMLIGLIIFAVLYPRSGTAEQNPAGIYGKVLTPDAAASFVYPLLGFTATLVIALMITIPEKLHEIPQATPDLPEVLPADNGAQYQLLHLRTTLAIGTKLMALLSFLVSVIQWTYMVSSHIESNLEVLGKSLLLTVFSLFTLFVANLIRNNTQLDEVRLAAVSARRLLSADYKIAVWSISLSQRSCGRSILKHRRVVGLSSLMAVIALVFGLPVTVFVSTAKYPTPWWCLILILAIAIFATGIVPVAWIYYVGLLSSSLTTLHPRAVGRTDIEANAVREMKRLELPSFRSVRLRNFPDATILMSSALTITTWVFWIAVGLNVAVANDVSTAAASVLSIFSACIPVLLVNRVWRSMLSVGGNRRFLQALWAAPRSNTVAALKREADSLRSSHKALGAVCLQSPTWRQVAEPTQNA